MFCLSCGKAIPDESRFCMHCGQPIHGKATSIKEFPPVTIDEVYFWFVGTKEERWQGLSISIGHGIGCSFSLLDSTGTRTSHDGQLTLAITSLPTARDAATLLSMAKRDPLFYKEIDVKKSDFRVSKFHNEAREWEQLSYTFVQVTPLVFVKHLKGHELHVWFRTPNGELLHNKSEWREWR